MTIMDKLKNLGYTFNLNIAVGAPATPPPEAAPLLSKLAAERDAAIETLVARYLMDHGPVPLPDTTPIPVPWEAELAFRKADENWLNLLSRATGTTEAQKATAIELQSQAELWISNPAKARERAAQGFKPEQQRMPLNLMEGI